MDIEKLADEIQQLKCNLAISIVKYGKAMIGENATMRQICNLASHKFGIPADECLKIVTWAALETDGETLE